MDFCLSAKIPPLPQIKLPKSMSKLRSRKIFRSSREDLNSVTRRASSKRKSTNSESLTLPLGHPSNIPPSEFINRTPNRISTISSLMSQNDCASGVSNKWKTKNAEEENFYRSAGGIEDYSPSPLNGRFEQRISRPISPVKAPPTIQEFHAQSEQNIKMSFGERFQKSYKDLAEFKLKHLFAKKTVVRTDQIEINEYIHRFDEDRKHDERVQEKIDHDIAENYRFKFKVSQQKSAESYAESPNSTPTHYKSKKTQKTVSELSGDESGMESTPPPRKPGIAATRFSRVRHTPLNMSLDEDNDGDDGIRFVENNSPKRNSEVSGVSQISNTTPDGFMESNKKSISIESSDDYELDVKDENSPKIKPNASSLYGNKKSKSIKERMNQLSKQKSEGDEKKRKAPLTPQQSQENDESTKSDKPFDNIKQNFKRLQKSIKLTQHAPAGDESENDQRNVDKTIFSKTQQQFTERIKRFRSTDQIDKNTEEDDNKESPIHKISNKLQEWKMSIRKKVDLHNSDNDDDYAGSPQKPIGSLMKKLKHIRSKKRDSTDDPDDDEEGGETYKESLASRAKLQLEKGVVVASQVPQRTMKKISETKKYFRKKQENDAKKPQSEEDDEDEEQAKPSPKQVAKTVVRPPPPRPPPIPRPHFTNSSDEDTDDREAFIAKSIAESQLITVPAARAVWTTRPILSDDTTDYDDELPRVLLHQDNSDIFESTLIIAVTRPISRTTTPIITELPPDSAEESTPDTKPDNWIPNQENIANVLEMTPPTIRKLSKDSNTTSSSKGHSRKDSIDSSSEDSWIRDIPRGPSVAVLNSVNENEEPWKIVKANTENTLYKTKSIDLFELQKRHGGVLTAFEDFDDELKNTPIVKIANEQPLQQNIHSNVDNSEHESSEELENPDDDNSSRITKISVHPPKIMITENAKTELGLKPQSYGNSRESLTGNLDEKDAIDSGAEDDNEESNDEELEVFKDVRTEHDRPPSKAPSPPPSKSPTPPPLPERQPPISLCKLNQTSLDIACPSEPPPPLPLTKPPVPPNRPAPAPKIPDRNPSMTRTSKPLVKTASLRLAYSEQVNPEDVGKVNKLISRFEPDGPKQRPCIVPRKRWLTNASEEYSDEEDEFELLPIKTKDKAKDTTPTNYPRIQKSYSIDSVDLPNNNEKLSSPSREVSTSLTRKATSQIVLDNSECATPVPSISISSTCLDVNSNFSQPSSVYGSPLPYPSSLVGSTEVTPLRIRQEPEQAATRRNRRSLARDDERFYSFDSDEGIFSILNFYFPHFHFLIFL